MGSISQVLGVVVGPSPATAAFPAVVFLVGRLRPATALLGFEEFLEGAEGSGDESDFTEEVGLEDGEGDDTKEQRDEGDELQLDEGQDGEELLQLLLLLATA